MEDERRLIQKARAGDQTAFETLVRLHQRMVYGLALSLTRSHQDAEEITQTVFLKAWRGLDRFRGEASLSTWLYRLTRNACTDLSRQNQKRREDRSLEDPALTALADRSPLPQEAAEQRERRKALLTALETLPEDSRTVLLLREVEGFSYQEIAQTLGLSQGTVKSRLSRARRALRDLLLADGTLWEERLSDGKKGGTAP
ncbi:MAG: sigma-70 family RNA polymerase sigma factor [Bacillota bacterium]|nr:sigma-70 family RNA polymerase sigma factor [Bacillota bacterium]